MPSSLDFLVMSSRRIIISRQVIFDESVFPFALAPSVDFLMLGLSPTLAALPSCVEQLHTPSVILSSHTKDPAIIYIGTLLPVGHEAAP